MFRRRMPLRPPPVGRLVQPKNPMALRFLEAANRAFVSGDYAEAAALFTRISHRGLFQGRPRAVNWLIKAGQANTLNGAVSQGFNQLLKGFEMLREKGRLEDLTWFIDRSITLFEQNGLTGEAGKVRDWVCVGQNEVISTVLDTQASSKKLPSKCPSCGAPVHLSTVEPVDNGQTACGYCGVILPDE